ncbi:MAG: hypothetical protein WAU02_03295 [Candidatus Saccharimonadales bacterium]
MFPQDNNDSQPTSTVTPATSDQPSQQPIESISQNEPTIPSKKIMPKIIITLVLAMLLVGAGVAAYLLLMPKSPDEVFKAALHNAFTTSSYTQKTEIEGSPVTIEMQYDVKDIKSPRVAASVSATQGSATLDMKSYGTTQKNYMQINTFDTGGVALIPDKLKGKWVEISEEDRSSNSILTGTLPMSSYAGTLGHYIVGNFKASERQQLIDNALMQKLYVYDAKVVTKEKVNETDTYVYTVKIDGDKLKEFNKKAAAMMGVDATKLNAVLTSIDSNDATMYISIKDQRLVKVKTDKSIVTYSKWNQTTLPTEPKADYQYAEYTKLMQQSPPASALQNVQAKSRDAQRTTDIYAAATQLEVYYNSNGYYPSINELNDPAWRSAHLPDLNVAAYTDPEGSSDKYADKPIAHQYSYQSGADSSLKPCSPTNQCNYFKISATMSDGTVFTKESLN